jgi:hypothetical protein
LNTHWSMSSQCLNWNVLPRVALSMFLGLMRRRHGRAM